MPSRTMTGSIEHLKSSGLDDRLLPSISDPTRFRHVWYLVGINKFELVISESMGPIGSGRVRVEIISNGHCESDLNVARHGKHPSQEYPEPRALLGHEPVGRIVAVGEGVPPSAIGKLVSIEPGISCGQCKACHAGLYNICPDVKYLATPANAKKEKGHPAWTEGSYCTSMDWPFKLCHELPEGANPTLSALAESVAACREARKEMAEVTHNFNQEEDYVLIVGAGQMAISLLVQLLRKYESLEIILMARSEKDRRFVEELGDGRVKTVALPQDNWQDTRPLRAAAESELMDGHIPSDLLARYACIKKMEEGNKRLLGQLGESFAKAKEMGRGSIACVFEVTGQSHIFEAATAARMIRQKGSYGLISCLYDVGYNEASARRDGGRTFRLRRSANQFPEAIRDINRHQAAYNQTVGRIVEFRDIPKLYDPETASSVGLHIGDGPKVIIKY